ncbi:MAG: hypothetical protein JJU12_03510 [Chlamydiales bacterium]|nr:hypothetical protein [Chlamydiales bacterium]
MNFTREPLIETVITSKDGYKLALRNSKGGGQEEFFVDAIEVISFGSTSFYRSLEKPKSFLVPVSDYEIIEVRETRMVLKSTSTDRGIKIAGGRETAMKPSREEKVEEPSPIKEVEAAVEEQKVEKRRERRRTRKRRGKSDQPADQEEDFEEEASPKPEKKEAGKVVEKPTLIPPPSTLISETINRYKEIVIHEPLKEEEPTPKKGEEFFEEPSEDSSEMNHEAQPRESVEDDEEVPF